PECDRIDSLLFLSQRGHEVHDADDTAVGGEFRLQDVGPGEIAPPRAERPGGPDLERAAEIGVEDPGEYGVAVAPPVDRAGPGDRGNAAAVADHGLVVDREAAGSRRLGCGRISVRRRRGT